MVANTSFWDGLFFTVYISFRECIDSWHWHIDLTIPIPKATISVAATVSVPWILFYGKEEISSSSEELLFRFSNLQIFQMWHEFCSSFVFVDETFFNIYKPI